jgi:hypothetical protein
MKQTILIRDIPVGVLLIVLAQFFIYGLLYITKFPSVMELLGIYLFIIGADVLFRVGLGLIIGKEVAKADE